MPQAQFNIAQSLQLALQQHAAGRLKEAAEIYRQILSADPQHSDSLRLLGVIATQDGRLQEAEDLIRRSITSQPHRPEAYHNLGDALRRQKKLDEAVASYQKAIELQPSWAE